MRNRGRVLLTALTAALVLGTMVGAASARRFEISNQQIRVVWPTGERLRFTGAGGTNAIECEVTLEGSYHSRIISKLSGQLSGYITRATFGHSCNGAELWFLNGVERKPGGEVVPNTLPWHVRYDRFIGALPSITGIRMQLNGLAFLFQYSFGLCLYKATAREPLLGIFELNAAGEITALRADEEAGARIPLQETIEGFCEERLVFARKGTVTLLGNTQVIRVRLIA